MKSLCARKANGDEDEDEDEELAQRNAAVRMGTAMKESGIDSMSEKNTESRADRAGGWMGWLGGLCTVS